MGTRIGVIGLGTIGRIHLGALRSLGLTEVVGADSSPAARAAAEANFGTRCFLDYREMLSTTPLDGVIVATPPPTHREIALAALDRELGVLCEKPLALTLEDCEAIARATSESATPFMVGFCHRFQPQVRALKELVSSGSFGHVALFTAAFVHGITERGREWITDPGQAGGGVLVDSGSHAIDLFRYLVGDVDEVAGLTASLDPAGSRQAVEDASVVGLRSGSTLGAIELSWKTPPWEGRIEVVGSDGRGRVEYDGEDVRLRTRLGKGGWELVETPPGNRFVLQLDHFLACLRGEAAPMVSARDGLEVTRIWLDVYRQAGNAGGHYSRIRVIEPANTHRPSATAG